MENQTDKSETTNSVTSAPIVMNNVQNQACNHFFKVFGTDRAKIVLLSNHGHGLTSLKRRYVMLAAASLIVLVFLSLFLIFNKPGKQVSAEPFYVGVEFAYGNQFSQLKALVDKVEN